MTPLGYMYGRGLKGHSETSTLSSQPSIDEVRQQMHLLLEEAFSLASGGQTTSGRHTHHHEPPPDHYSSASPPLPYADVVTSAPGTMRCGRGALQWVPSYGADIYQCTMPKPVSSLRLFAFPGDLEWRNSNLDCLSQFEGLSLHPASWDGPELSSTLTTSHGASSQDLLKAVKLKTDADT